MSGVIPVREAHRTRCEYCGNTVTERNRAENTAEYGEGIEIAVPFCSDDCAKAYSAQKQEDIEEFEEIFRAGAT